MISRRKTLEALTRSRLLEVARAFDISGLTGKPKDEIVARLSRARTVDPEALLALFSRCFNICQAFFPGGGKNPWQRLARALRGTVNEEAFEDLRSLKSISSTPGKKIAVKVIDHRGNEMLEVFEPSVSGVES